MSDAATEAAGFQRQNSRELAGAALENLKKNGMQISEFSPAETAKFRDKMNPVLAKHAATVGADTVAALQAELVKVRK